MSASVNVTEYTPTHQTIQRDKITYILYVYVDDDNELLPNGIVFCPKTLFPPPCAILENELLVLLPNDAKLLAF